MPYPIRICGFLFILLLAIFSDALVLNSQDDPQNQKTTVPVESPSVDPKLLQQLGSPRQTLSTFFEAVLAEDYETAILCLDTSELDPVTIETKSKSYCNKIFVLLNDCWHCTVELAPSDPDALTPFNMGMIIDAVDSANFAEDAAKLELVKSKEGLWRFSSASIALVDSELYDRWATPEATTTSAVVQTIPMWLESQVPENLRSIHFLIKDYQWIALLILMVIGFAVDILSRYLLNFLTNRWFRWRLGKTTYRAERNLWKPVGLLLNALTWYYGAKLIDLPASFLAVLLVALKFFAVFASIWTAFSGINLLSDYLLRKAEQTRSRYDDLLIPFIRNGLKILAVCVGLVLFVDVFSLNWNSLLGGFGLGGIAIAIASKDVLGNVFGSLTVLTDRPFEIGDWVVTEGVEGEVESVGMRSSRIRTFYNSLVIVPNSRLTTAIVDNMGRRRFRRVKAMLGVTYGSSVDQLEAFCEGIRELIRTNEKTRKDYFHVYVNEFGGSSINILMYFFLKCNNWGSELEEKHRIYLNIMRLAASLKIEFAFPTQTIHMFQESEPKPEAPDWGEASPGQAGVDAAQDIMKRA